MPDMDGLEAAEKIRAHPEGKATTIFAVTASLFSRDRERLESIGIDEIIRKPYRDDILFDAIVRHTGIRLRYAEPEMNRVPPDTSARKMGEAFQALPKTLREQLQIASDSGALSEIARLVAEVRPHDAALGEHLEQLADSFNLHGLAEVFASEAD